GGTRFFPLRCGKSRTRSRFSSRRSDSVTVSRTSRFSLPRLANIINRPAALSSIGSRKERPMPPTSRNEQILVVDDDQAIRWSLREALQSWGFESTEAASVKEALTRF